MINLRILLYHDIRSYKRIEVGNREYINDTKTY